MCLHCTSIVPLISTTTAIANTTITTTTTTTTTVTTIIRNCVKMYSRIWLKWQVRVLFLVSAWHPKIIDGLDVTLGVKRCYSQRCSSCHHVVIADSCRVPSSNEWLFTFEIHIHANTQIGRLLLQFIIIDSNIAHGFINNVHTLYTEKEVSFNKLVEYAHYITTNVYYI